MKKNYLTPKLQVFTLPDDCIVRTSLQEVGWEKKDNDFSDIGDWS